MALKLEGTDKFLTNCIYLFIIITKYPVLSLETQSKAPDDRVSNRDSTSGTAQRQERVGYQRLSLSKIIQWRKEKNGEKGIKERWFTTQSEPRETLYGVPLALWHMFEDRRPVVE